MDTENENAKEFSLSKSAKPQEKDLSVFHEEQRAEKSNEGDVLCIYMHGGYA